MIIFLSIVMYLFSCRCAFLFIQKSHHHYKGRWNNVKPVKSDRILVFVPVINTIFTLLYMVGYWKRDQDTDYFKPKK